jgi:DNA-binding transcriptional MerR regulator
MLNIGGFARLGQVSPRRLRHYDQLGLLVPERVDPETGYRSYGVHQLVRLHRLLALRDLGFTLEQISGLLEQSVAEEQGRLRRVEAHLRAIEGSNSVNAQDVVVKTTEPLRVAEARGIAAGLDPEHIGPLFGELAPKLSEHLQRSRRWSTEEAWKPSPPSTRPSFAGSTTAVSSSSPTAASSTTGSERTGQASPNCSFRSLGEINRLADVVPVCVSATS